MQCQSAGNSQAVCIGGQNPESNAPWNITDEWEQGIGVIDMTNLVLKDNYDASAPPYTAPEPVRTAYERGLVLQLFFFFAASSNKSRELSPTIKWASQGARDLFENFNYGVPPRSKLSKKDTISIAIIVTVVILFIILAGGDYYWSWRKKLLRGLSLGKRSLGQPLKNTSTDKDANLSRRCFGAFTQKNNTGMGWQTNARFVHTINVNMNAQPRENIGRTCVEV
jgi:hypothetical protein